MKNSEFEDYIVSLKTDEYEALVQERISRLDKEQQVIAQAREVKAKERHNLINKMFDAAANSDEDAHHALQNLLRDEGVNACEHGRSYCKHCVVCAEIDHIMFPEIFDKDGERIEF